jgi:glycine cleavage system H protein
MVFFNSFFVILQSKAHNMSFPENLRYTKDHEWIKIEKDDIAIVGITDFAQKELGDIVYVEIESSGKELGADTVFGTVEAVKTVSDLYLPVAGMVLEINPALANSPELVNTDPYGEGWMIKLKLKNPSDIDGLMDASAYAGIAG